MNHNELNFKIIAPINNNPESIFNQKILKPFDDISIEFIAKLSKKILENSNLRKFPELISMAFWIRKSNLLKIKKTYESSRKNKIWIGRGITFHIAPSNVDTIFIYSWFLSLLVGNINIIRMSQRRNEQLNVLIGMISEISNLKEFQDIKKRFLIITYEHDDNVTLYFSKKCDVRVIWGGDKTINKIRSIGIKPSAIELSFSDKFSMAAFNADKIISNKNNNKLCEDFFNDAFWFDQLACSSPKLICWIGNDDKIDIAKKIFWNEVESIHEKKNIDFHATRAIDKMVASYSLAIDTDDVLIYKNPLIQRIEIKSQELINRELHCGAGLFYEISLKSLDTINEIIIEKDQTLGIFGFNEEEIREFLFKKLPKGIHRIVKIGKMMDFSNIWDGHDLLREFSREVSIDL